MDPTQSSETLIVLRHGATQDNQEDRYQGQLDTLLCQEGVEQIRSASAALMALGVGRIISSPLLRARQSAEIIAGALSCPTTRMPEFKERCMGVFEGLTRSEAKLRFPALYRPEVMEDFDWAPPDGESLTEVATRVHRGLLRIPSGHPTPIVLVTHGTVARVLRWLFGRVEKADFFEYSLGNAAFEFYSLDEYRGQRLTNGASEQGCPRGGGEV